VARFRDAGYSYEATAGELNRSRAQPAPASCSASFISAIWTACSTQVFSRADRSRFPEQPDLTEEVSAALSVLSRTRPAFFLMVESGLNRQYTHSLDMERRSRHHHARQCRQARARLGERARRRHADPGVPITIIRSASSHHQ